MRVQIKQMTKTIAAWILVIGMLVTSIPMNTLAIEGQTGETSHPSIETTDTAASDNAVDSTLETTDQAGSQTAESISSGTEETPTIDETAPTEGTTTDPAASVEEESTEVHFKVTYHEETPTTDWIYQIAYHDENDVEQYYIGRYYIYDQNGTCLSPKDGDSIDDTQKGKITIPAKNEIPENAETIEKYRLNKEDSTLQGFTVTLKDVKEQTLYTIIQSQNAGLKLDDSDPKLTKEQQVIAQKDSDNHPEEEDAKINTATFNYKGIEEVTAEGQTSTEEKDETQPTEDSTNEATTETDQSVNAETDATAETDSENADASQTGEIAEETAAPTTERITEGAALLGATEKKSIVSNRKVDEAVMLLQSGGTNEENAPQVTQPQIVLNGDGLAGHTFTYEIKTNADPAVAYNGKYKIIPPDTKEEDLASIQPQQCNNGKIDISNCASGTKIILLDADDTTEYNVEDKTNSSDTNNLLHEHSDNLQTITSTSKSVSFGYRTKTDQPVTLTKIWADGHASHSREVMDGTDNNAFIKLYYQVQDNTSESEATPQNLGINENWEIECDSSDTSGLTIWTYTYSNLPKCDANGNEITYYAKESNSKLLFDSDKYITTYNETTITNTLKVNTDNINSDYSATINWKDKETGAATPASRPTDETFKENVTIKRYIQGSTNREEIINSKDYIDITNTNDNWTVSLKDLPKYDSDGNEYVYYIEQNDTSTSYAFSGETKDGKYYYKAEYNNTGAYGINTDGLYNGGTLTDSRRETGGFTFNVKWEDGDDTWLRNSKLYLYRFAGGDETAFDTASPVQGFDQMYFENGKLYYEKNDQKVEVPGTLNQDGSYSYTWYGNDGKLDEYAPSGAKYTYYIVQKDLGKGATDATSTSDYSTKYNDTNDENAAQKDNSGKVACIVNNGTIINTLTKNESPTIHKSWEAKAIQGSINNLSITLNLQKRYVVETLDEKKNIHYEYSSWQPILNSENENANAKEYIEGGFSDAVPEKDVKFGTESYPGYTTEELFNVDFGNNSTKNLPKGTKIEYQCIETGVTYGETPVTFDGSGKAIINNVGQNGTSMVISQEYTYSSNDENSRVITGVKNVLEDQTQVTVKKVWSMPEGTTLTDQNQTKEGDYWPEDGKVVIQLGREDGKPVKNLNGNSVSNITLTKETYKDVFTNLPRYDEQGREIVYYVTETSCTNNAGLNYSYNNTNYTRDNAILNENTENQLTIRQTNAVVSNTLPGKGLHINVNKRWLDDGDQSFRYPVIMGIFAKEDIAEGTAFNSDGTLSSDNAVATATLNDGGAWTQHINFNGNESNTASDYIALEMYIQKPDNTKYNVTYNVDYLKTQVYDKNLLVDYGTFSANNGNETSKRIGEVSTDQHLYHVYLGETSANGMSGYVVYNQRWGEQEIDISKTWICGNLHEEEKPKAAFFKVYQYSDSHPDGIDVTDIVNLDSDNSSNASVIKADSTTKIIVQKEVTLEDKTTTIQPVTLNPVVKIETVPNNDQTSVMKAVFNSLPKYDSLGRLMHYGIEEVAVEDPNPNNNSPIYRAVNNGTVKVSVKQDGSFKYQEAAPNSKIAYYDQYSCGMNETIVYGTTQHTNDVYSFSSTNKRQQTFDVSLKKVWRDDGTANVQTEVNTFRPDIYFRLYRIACGTQVNETTINTEADLLSLTKEQALNLAGQNNLAQQVGGDYTWNTKRNDWYWTCDTDGVFDRYDENGNEYLYFALEYSNNWAGYTPSYYNGETIPNEKVNSQTPTNTQQVLDYQNPTGVDAPKLITNNLLIVHKEGDGLQSNGSVINTKKETFDATATKIWKNIPTGIEYSALPGIRMELRRRLVLDEKNHIYGEWETISAVDGANGATTSYSFPSTDKYDEYGRKYEFEVQERYYQVYNSLDVATKLTMNANSQFFTKTVGSSNDSATYRLVGEGVYVSLDNGNTFESAADKTSFVENAKFYYKAVDYNQVNSSSVYVKIGDQCIAYENLSDTEKQMVSSKEMYTDCNCNTPLTNVYVKNADYDYVPLTDSMSNVRLEQLYTKEEGRYVEFDDSIYLGCDYVPGYTDASQAEGNKFTWTNAYDPNAAVRQRVEIKIDKTWIIPSYASGNLPDQNFQLWRKISGTDVDELVSTDVKKELQATETTDGNKKLTYSFVFKTSDQNGDTTNYLPYFAPNGEPYTYYIKEVVPAGYLGSVKGADQTYATKQGTGSDADLLISQDVKLNNYRYVTESNGTKVLVLSNVPYDETTATYSTVAADQDLTTQYTNTYNGVPVVTNQAKKVWNDLNNAYGTRPDDINLTLKQSGGGNTEEKSVAFSFADASNTNRQNANGSWSNNKETTSEWTFIFTNGYINSDTFLADARDKDGNLVFTTNREPNGNFPMYGPNGEKYTYTVEEAKAKTDTNNQFDSYIHSDSVSTTSGNAITNTITNTLPTTDITAKKIWQGKEGTSTWIYDGNNDTHTDTELEKLYNMRAMPTKITFTLQYTDQETPQESDWQGFNPAKTQEYTLDTIQKVKDVRDTGGIFKDLPLYSPGNHTGTSYRKYRIVETAEYATGQTVENCFQYQSNQNQSAVNGGTTTVTNELTLQTINLQKVWNDGTNYMNTRPESIKFNVSITGLNGSQDYTLTKDNDKDSTDNNLWKQTVMVPTGTVNVSEIWDDQDAAVKTLLNDHYQEPVVRGTTVTNSIKTDLTKRTTITAKKTWDDSAYTSFMKDLIRPASITYTLYCKYDTYAGAATEWKVAGPECNVKTENTSAKKAEITVYPKEDGTWQDAVWSDLFQYYRDNDSDTAYPITYKVVETAVTGYSTTYTGNEIVAAEATPVTDTFNTTAEVGVTNTIVDTQKVTLKKVWNSADLISMALANADATGTTIAGSSKLSQAIKDLQDDGILPQALKFQLQYKAGTNGTWTPLEKYEEYAETNADGHKLSDLIKGKEVYSNLPAKDKSGNDLSYRFVEVGVKFTGDQDYRPIPVQTGGKDILYTVSGPTDADSTTITNTVPEGTIQVTKAADDEDNRDGRRKEIGITLKRNGAVYAEATLTYNNGTWSTTTFKVPIYNAGQPDGNGFKKNIWTVEETTKPEAGYTPSYIYKLNDSECVDNDSKTTNQIIFNDSGAHAGKVEITNTRTPKRFQAIATKTWEDTDAFKTETRPATVDLKLQYKSGSGDDDWTDVTPAKAVSIWQTTKVTADGTTYDAIYYNDRYYKWDAAANSGSGAYVIDGSGVYTTSSVTQAVQGSATNGSLTATWENLSAYQSGGTKIKYRVIEPTELNGYTVTYTNQVFEADDSTTSVKVGVTNTLKDPARLIIVKNWEADTTNPLTRAMRPDQVQYLVEYKTEATSSTWKSVSKDVLGGTTDGVYIMNTPLTQNSTDQTSHAADLCCKNNNFTLPELPYQDKDGNQYIYRVSETALIYKNGTSADTVVNANITTNGTLNWTYASDTKVSSITGTAGAYTASMRTSYNNSTSKEKPWNRFWKAEATNTLETETLTATKQWEDAGNRELTRPELSRPEVTFTASQWLNGTKVGNVTNADGTASSLKANAANSYTVAWTNLPKYQKLATAHDDTAANRYTYEVTETAVTGYTTSYEQSDFLKADSNGNVSAKVINTKDLQVFSINGKKAWDDSTSGKEMLNPYTKPATVDLTLQYRIDGTNDAWQNITKVPVVEASTFPTTVVKNGTADATVIYFKKEADTSEDGTYRWDAAQSKYVSATAPDTVKPLIVTASALPNTKYNDAEYITFTKVVVQGDGYYRWDTDKYVPDESGAYTTSEAAQEIDTTKADALSTWDRLPAYAKTAIDGQDASKKILYRVVETEATKAANPYLASIPSATIDIDSTTKEGTVTNKLNEIKLIKKNSNGDKVGGINFKIEEAVCDAAGTVTGWNVLKDSVSTSTASDTLGEITFAGLKAGKYRITELSTTEGYQLLSAPFIVDVPLVMTVAEKAAYDGEEKTIDMTNAIEKDDCSGWEFYQLTYTVTNTANFDMPLTGNKGNWNYGLFALIPFAAVCIIYRRRKKYNKA